MLKTSLKFGILGLVALTITVFPVRLIAQETNKPAAEKKEHKPKKSGVMPFHGKLKAVDKTAETISVGELTIQITSETKVWKDGKPAVLADGVVNEPVSGAYKKSEDGKLDATKVTFGKKAGKEEAKKETKVN